MLEIVIEICIHTHTYHAEGDIVVLGPALDLEPVGAAYCEVLVIAAVQTYIACIV